MMYPAFIGALATAVCAAAITFGAAAEIPTPLALSSIKQGQWELRSLDGAPSKTVCLGDARALLQLRHGNASCNKFIITNTASQTVVHYSCAGSGNGRTSIRVETPRVIQIESQGVADKAPFDIAYEGRRVGECAISGPTARR